ncbi:phytoene/squalene synthase family protein, partial [Chloroflexota bacterium]
QKADDFHHFREDYNNALNGQPAENPIIDSFIELMQRKGFNPQWVESFLDAMELDLTKKVYSSLEEIIDYMYGSAEVIGLLMSRILDLPPEADLYARMQGRAMQYINFIRDIEEDQQLGRTYLPLNGSGITSLDHEYALSKPDEFIQFVHIQINRYREWQLQASKGFHYIPLRYLIPVKTASDLYEWTAKKIERDPLIVFYKKVKPSRNQVRMKVISNTLRIRTIRSESSV